MISVGTEINSHFMSHVSFYNPRKYHKTGGIERDKWYEISQYHMTHKKTKNHFKQKVILYSLQTKVILYLTISMLNKFRTYIQGQTSAL